MLASRPTSGAAANRGADKAEAAGQQEFDGVVQAVMAAAAQMAQPPESSASLRPPSPAVAPAEGSLPVEGPEAQLSLQQTASVVAEAQPEQALETSGQQEETAAEVPTVDNGSLAQPLPEAAELPGTAVAEQAVLDASQPSPHHTVLEAAESPASEAAIPVLPSTDTPPRPSTARKSRPKTAKVGPSVETDAPEGPTAAPLVAAVASQQAEQGRPSTPTAWAPPSSRPTSATTAPEPVAIKSITVQGIAAETAPEAASASVEPAETAGAIVPQAASSAPRRPTTTGALIPTQQVYIPLSVAKAKLAQVVNDMTVLQSRHLAIVKALESRYKALLEQNKEKFAEFIGSLRHHYDGKVAICYKIMEAQKKELQGRIESLANDVDNLRHKNGRLQNENIDLLVRAKDNSGRASFGRRPSSNIAGHTATAEAAQSSSDFAVVAAEAANLPAAEAAQPATNNAEDSPAAAEAGSEEDADLLGGDDDDVIMSDAEDGGEDTAAAAIDTSYNPLVDSLQTQVGSLQQSLLDASTAFASEKSQLQSRIHSLTEELSALKAAGDAALLAAQEEANRLQLAIKGKEEAVARTQADLAAANAKNQQLQEERLAALPLDAAQEIKQLQATLATEQAELIANREALAEAQTFVAQLEARVQELQNRVASLSADAASQSNLSKDAIKTAQAEISALQAAVATSAAQQQVFTTQEAAVAALRQQLTTALKQRDQALAASAAGTAGPENEEDAEGAGTAVETAAKAKTNNSAAGGAQTAQTKRLQAELNKARKEIERLSQKLEAGAGGGGGGGPELQRTEKKLREAEKRVEAYKAQDSKNKEKLAAVTAQVAEKDKAVAAAQEQAQQLRVELKAAQAAAAESVAVMEEFAALKTTSKTLKEQNQQLQENFNSERVLRKKYYNIIEDMKGKIRVYCRVRPLSGTEKERGNHSVINSPDEYTAVVDDNDRREEFGFDSVFMPDTSQEAVYEDTGNLIQSAVDGFNVCIFAYGQTGSGKTFTMIGDSNKPMKYPGLAPRAFKDIFKICEENKSKFSYKVSCYMIELYCDKLIDLFAEHAPVDDESKLKIRKDKNGLVVVENSIIKEAKDAEELYSFFEHGSENRHVASTKMNSESSRSHLVIGIIVETTNLISGTVMTGKLSLVDLAGSERAGKTGATGQQIIEAKSINKSLSALGNVIFALSENAQHVPYRDNLLTQLMQDSLGGNAKTLMFVNISPADYNTEETINSLKYARRVKLITNDAKKNADNKEIARLKEVIKRLRSGEALTDEELDL